MLHTSGNIPFLFRCAFVVTLFFFVSVFFVSGAQAQLGVRLDQPGLVSECDFCLCSQGISPLEMARSGVRYDFRIAELSHEFLDGKRTANTNNEDEIFVSHQVTFIYNAFPNFTAIAIAPFATRHATEMDPVGGASTFDNSGLGDLSILGRYNLISDHEFANTRIVSLSAGVKLPTGTTTKKDATGDVADPDLQLGTGSTDIMLGGGFLLGFDNWSIGANLIGAVTGHGANGHTYGDNLNYDLTARYRVIPQNAMTDPAIFAAMGLRGELRGHELQDGAIIDNSGGNVLYLAPGVQIYFTPTISFDATYLVPIVHALNGDQLGETFKFLSGIQLAF